MDPDDKKESTENAQSVDNAPGGLDGLTEYLGLDAAQPDHDPLIGHDVGGVTILRPIAEGGMGRVYEGLQQKPKRSVAVKVIRPGFVSKDVSRRFDNESELLGKLRHPYIAQVYSAGICRIVGTEVPFFVMEYIPDALSLTKYAKARQLTIHQRLELFRKVCEAVAYGHANGVIHRDLKPSNILVEPSGIPKVIDFGVARSINLSSEQMTALTDVGHLVGTVQYMSPEQFSADPRDVDVRADVYALGVILYELLTGRPPYEIRQKQIFEAAEVVRKYKPTLPSKLNRGVGRGIEKITGKCLHKNRQHRYADAGELATAIDVILRGQSDANSTATRNPSPTMPRAHKLQLLFLGGLLAVVVGAGYYLSKVSKPGPAADLEKVQPEPSTATSGKLESPLVRSTKPVVAIPTQSDRPARALVERLTAMGLQIADISGELKYETMSRFPLVYVQGGSLHDQEGYHHAEVEAVRRYVAEGGALLCAGVAWAWGAEAYGNKPIATFPLNQIGVALGFEITGQVADQPVALDSGLFRGLTVAQLTSLNSGTQPHRFWNPSQVVGRSLDSEIVSKDATGRPLVIAFTLGKGRVMVFGHPAILEEDSEIMRRSIGYLIPDASIKTK